MRVFVEFMVDGRRVPVFVAEHEAEAVLELKKAYEHRLYDCRLALRGLGILMERRAPAELVERLDNLMAKAIRNGACWDEGPGELEE